MLNVTPIAEFGAGGFTMAFGVTMKGGFVEVENGGWGQREEGHVGEIEGGRPTAGVHPGAGRSGCLRSESASPC